MRRRRIIIALALVPVLAAAAIARAQDVIVAYDGGGESYWGHDGGVDWNGDGKPDFLVTGDDRATVVVVSGATGLALDTYALPEGTPFASRFTPDMTGDGEPDLIVGANRGGRSTSPPALIYLIDGVSGEMVWESAGNSPGEGFGTDLDVLGDVTGDGIPDVLAAGWNTARCLSGADGARVYEFSSTGACCPSEGVRALGDIDGDDVPDFLVASQRFSGEFFGDDSVPSNSGLVRVVSGATGEIIRVHRGKAELALVGIGFVVLDDIDRDGASEYAVAANIVKGKTFNPGFTIYSGRSGRKLAAVLLPSIPGAKGFQLLPDAPGDADRDGVPDYLLRITKNEGGEAVVILSGRPTDEPILFRYDVPEGEFITAVGVAGDVSDPPDGVPDLIVSQSQPNRTRVYEVKARPFIPPVVRNARAFSRDTGDDRPISARLSVAVKKGTQSFAIATTGLSGAATGPFSVFLEDGVGADSFSQIGTLDAAGAYTVSATGMVPPELGVSSLADVVGRRVQLRDGGGAVLLETVVPDLIKAKKQKAKGALAPVSAEFPKASLKLKAAFNPKTGAVDLKAKVKNAGDGPFVFQLETAPDSGEYAEIARVEGSKLKLSTGTGAPLAGAFSVEDLIGRGLRVYSGETLVLEGDL